MFRQDSGRSVIDPKKIDFVDPTTPFIYSFTHHLLVDESPIGTGPSGIMQILFGTLLLALIGVVVLAIMSLHIHSILMHDPSFGKLSKDHEGRPIQTPGSTDTTDTTDSTGRMVHDGTTTDTADSRPTSKQSTTAMMHMPNPFFQSSTTGNHIRSEQRVVLSFTVVPSEIPALVHLVQTLLQRESYLLFDAIHVCIPWMPLRQPTNGASFDTTADLLSQLPSSPRIILHRLPDVGPMTRYIGPLQYEQHPSTRIVIFDIDSDHMDFASTAAGDMDVANISLLVHASLTVDPDAVWCNMGQDFAYHQGTVQTVWHSSPAVNEQTFKWNHVHMCRGVKGLLFQPRFFDDFWYNQTDYHESCFWDDDRWTSFQFERQHIPRKEVHSLEWKDSYIQLPTRKTTSITTSSSSTSRRRLGSLSNVNNELKPEQTCAPAWLEQHPETFLVSRTILF